MKNPESELVAPVEVSVHGTQYRLVLPDASTDYIQGLIAREHRPYEPDLLDDMRQRMKPGDLFVDVGANVGNHTLFMASVAGCRVAAFEPNARLCEAMRASVAVNNLGDRVQVHPQGVGRTSGKARFEAELPKNLGAQRLLLDSGDIDIVALDAVDLTGPVRMLKVDVEGMEIDVLEGAMQMLRQDRPVVYVECIRERDFREVSRRLDALGYCYWDTFNATPTHLFLPFESVPLEQRIGRLQNKQVEDEYRLAVLTKDVRNRLTVAQEREAGLRQAVEQVHQGVERQQSTLDTLRSDLFAYIETQTSTLDALRADNLRWYQEALRVREDATTQLARAQEESAQLQRQVSNEQVRAAALAEERQRLQRETEALTLRVESAERRRDEAIARLDWLKGGTTFRVGEAILKIGKSPRALLKLPFTLWRIGRDARHRRLAKAASPANARCEAGRAPGSPLALASAHRAPAAPRADIAQPDAGWFSDLRRLRVGVVGSDGIAAVLGTECRVVDASAEGEGGPQLLLVDVSAAASSQWATADGQPRPGLSALIERCRGRNVPSLLWLHGTAGADPRHLPWAQLVDHLFVADLEAIAEWRGVLGHDRVHLLPWGIASERDNPLQRGPGEDAFALRALGGHDPQSPSDLPSAPLEALARHGISASGYSHALRLLFGNLVIATDQAGERERQIAGRRAEPLRDRRLRLAALHKVHEEHGLAQRLATVAQHVTGGKATAPRAALVCVVAVVGEQAEVEQVMASHRRQRRPADLLLLVAPEPLQVPEAADVRRVDTLRETAAATKEFDAVVPLSPRDDHGPDYIADLLLAWRWAPGATVTRGAVFRAGADGQLILDEDVGPYQRGSRAALRRSLLPVSTWAQHARAGDLVIEDATIEDVPTVSIDAFGLCLDAHMHGVDAGLLASQVHGECAGGGVGYAQLEALAPVFATAPGRVEPALSLKPREWLARLPAAPDKVTLRMEGERVVVESLLEPGAYHYLYLSDSYPAARLGTGERVCELEGEGDRSLLFVLVYLDSQRKKLGHAMYAAGKRVPLVLPSGTAFVKLALRIEGPGRACLGTLTASAPRPLPRPVVGSAKHLLITKQYPDYNDLYRFAFVHSRVRAYLQEGGAIDVLRVRPEPGRWHREFENVDITEADLAHLDSSLAHGVYESLLVHFMDPPIWHVLRRHLDKVRVTVWVHGADVQPWWRRASSYEQPAQRDKARNVTDERLATWRELFALAHPNLKVVFVSRKQADETLCDLGIDPDHAGIEVIHNFIDGELFAYHEKPPEQRLRILSIRPYASAVYANDLTAQAILHLSKRPVFRQLHFRLIGDGVLWEQTVAPLRGLRNVELTRGFVTQREIAALHRDYGVFLVPSRMDSQGVSRDEAMASGLVPVTTRVAAIPEFVDESCAMLCPPENALALADAIEALATDPARFQALSRAAAERVRRQSGREQTIGRELALVERQLPSAPPLNRFDRRIAVYGDLNLNIVDGSAVWAASLTETLAGLPRTQVCLLLKTRIQRTTVIARLLGLAPSVQIVEPSLQPQQAMAPADAVQRLVDLDAARPFRAFVLRGLELCTWAAATPQLRGRIWAYLTDVPQSADALDEATRRRMEAIIAASEFLLCQTPQMDVYLQSLFPAARGRTRLLPPMLPVSGNLSRPAKTGKGPLRLCYAGKFAPNWGIAELAEAFREWRRLVPDAELHVYGDKIHNVANDPGFQQRTAQWLSGTPGLIWHGAVERDQLLRELPTMDVCWAYRDPQFEHGTLELSTKLLEYASLGVPTVLTRSPVNESVLGPGYPLFVESAAQAQALLARIATDRALLVQAADQLRAAASGYSFEAVRDRLVAQGLG